MKIIWILIFISFYSCESSQKINSDIERNNWVIMFEDYNNLDSLSKSRSNSKLGVDFFANDSTSDLQLTLVYDKKRTILLKYPSFDITGDFVCYSKLYFNDKGKPFAIAQLTEEKSILLTLFDIEKGLFLFDTLTDKQSFPSKKAKRYKDFTYQCEIVKEVDNWMHKFSSIGAYRSSVCLDFAEDIEVNVDSIPLFINGANGEFLIETYLIRGTRLKYIEADTSSVNFKNESTYFLKVSTIDKRYTGWIYYIAEDFMDVEELDLE